MKTGLTKRQKRTSICFTGSRRVCRNLYLQHRLQKAADGFCRQIPRRMPSTGRRWNRLQNLCRQKGPFWHPLDGTLQRKETASSQCAGKKGHAEFEEDNEMKFLSCRFNMDTACVELRCADRRVVSIYTPAVEDEYAENMYQRSELDWLIDHDPVGYAQLVLHGDVRKYLDNVTGDQRLGE